MSRNDWIGVAASVVFHTLLLIAFAFMTAAAPERKKQTPELGFIAVELGSASHGRPVRRGEPNAGAPARPKPAATRPARTTTRPAEAKKQQPQARPEPARRSRPVNVPKTQPSRRDPDRVRATPQTERPTPEVRDNPPEPKKEEPREESRAEQASGSGGRTGAGTGSTASSGASGARDGGTSGAATGDPGTGTDERNTGYDISGLGNRSLLVGPRPAYRAQVNSTIVVEFFVDPRGNVRPGKVLRKGNPTLERDALAALRRWRFSPLPAGAPQQEQRAQVTFRFRLD